MRGKALGLLFAAGLVGSLTSRPAAVAVALPPTPGARPPRGRLPPVEAQRAP